jgi:hypothetical protein
MRLYNDRLVAELKREENPDTLQPDGDWLKTRYENALAAAQSRAAVGTKPKPGTGCENVYKSAILSRLQN